MHVYLAGKVSEEGNEGTKDANLTGHPCPLQVVGSREWDCRAHWQITSYLRHGLRCVSIVQHLVVN